MFQVSGFISPETRAILIICQRLKGAIDSRIAEEQARQRAAVNSASPSRSGSTSGRRSLPRNLSPSKRPRPREKAELATEKGPDPTEFDSDFTLEDDSANIGAFKNEVSKLVAKEQKLETEALLMGAPETGITMEIDEGAMPAQGLGEVSTEVRVKLRKLERIESKYQELLGAYRLAHARVQTIEPFEASLRENTPLTSISDPGALLEYLKQVNLKSDMAVEELKRVTAERDRYRNQFGESEKEAQALRAEVSNFKQLERTPDLATEQPAVSQKSYDLSNTQELARAVAVDSTAPVKSPTPSTSSRLPSFSLFSPKSKAVKSPQEDKDTSEEFFSYDSELPRLEAELQERQTEIADLKKQISTLQADLSVARESTEGMVQNLEAATRELQTLRDVNEKLEAGRRQLPNAIENLEQKTPSLMSPRVALSQEDPALGSQLMDTEATLEEKDRALASTSKAEEERETEVAVIGRDTHELYNELAQKDTAVKEPEDSSAIAQSAEWQQDNQPGSELVMALKDIRNKSDIETKSLLELKTPNDREAEARRKLTDEAVDRCVTHAAEQPSTKYFGFVNDGEFSLSGDAPNAFRQFATTLKNARPELYEAIISLEKKSVSSLEASPAPSDTTKMKKRRKKKKKNGLQGSVAGDAILAYDIPAKITETLDEAEVKAQRPNVLQSTKTQDVEERIKDLETQIQQKDTTIYRLNTRLKDQDVLIEEIDTLRDDLVHQGEGNVQARDALKVARDDKSACEKRVADVEKELADLKARSAAGSADSERAQNDLLSALEDLKSKATALQRDLAAAEQLAASRFKDIADLRELLSQAQSELRSLRSELAELRPIKDDLRNKDGELTRLESRHEDLKADIKSLSRKIAEKDAEVKTLWRKLGDECDARIKKEEELQFVRAELLSAQEAMEAAKDSQKKASDDLSSAKADQGTLQGTIRGLEAAISKHVMEAESLKQQVDLKISLHESSQAMVTGLKEQTLELSTQARETSNRADSLEEELAEAQKMLSERSREGEIMRSLLAEEQGRTSTKIREMKEHMEFAIEERDRIEDEASTSNRRMAREVENLRHETRESTRSLKAVEEEKEELERSQRDLRLERDQREAAQESAQSEAQMTIQRLREALDHRDRESMELERQKADTKRMREEVQERVEHLQKANKALTDELRSIQQQRKATVRLTSGIETGAPSSRSSLDSGARNARNDGVVGSPPPNVHDRLRGGHSSTPTAPNGSVIDYVYLKNVLLQFLEQKDKGHQKQLIPVLGMLLNFDR